MWIARSGTTARVDGDVHLVALTHEGLVEAAAASNQHLDAGAEDRWIRSLPGHHVGGLSIHIRAALAANEVVVDASRWQPTSWAERVAAERITLASLVPMQLFDLVEAAVRSPPSLRAVLVGGDALAPSLYSRARALGWPLLPTFGMTEAASQVATAPRNSLETPPDAFRASLPALRVLPHLHARVALDPQARAADDDGQAWGRLELRGPSIACASLTVRSDGTWSRADPRVDGWLRTDDRVALGDGTLRPLGRASSLIKVRGHGVDLAALRARIEACLPRAAAAVGRAAADPRVMRWLSQHVALTAAADPRDGARLVLAHAPSPALGLDAEARARVLAALVSEYDTLCRPYERIAGVVEIEAIPRGRLGKIQEAPLARAVEARVPRAHPWDP